MPVKKHKFNEKQENVEKGQPQGEGKSGEIPHEAVEAPAVISEAEIAQLHSDLDQAIAKSTEYLEGWQRERAEFYNYKKRIEREQVQGGQNALGNAVRRYLDIADDLDRALKSKNRPREGDDAVWADGIELIHRKLISAFEADGVKMIEITGKYFDPNLHEAISNEDSKDHESGQIIEVVQPGYTLGERVIRPARVRVAR
jgi:molecular chaperone GrpE